MKSARSAPRRDLTFTKPVRVTMIEAIKARKLECATKV